MNSGKQSIPKTPTLSQAPPTTSVLPKAAQIRSPATFSQIQLPLPAPPATTSTAPPRTTPAAKWGMHKKRPTGPSSSKTVPTAGKSQPEKSPKAVSELQNVATASSVPVDSPSRVIDLQGIAEIFGNSRLKRRRLLQRQRSREIKKRKMTALARNDKQPEFELESDEGYSAEFELPPKVEVYTHEQREYDLAYTDHVLETQYTESWPTSSDTDSDGMSPPFVTQTSKTVSTSRKVVPPAVPPRKEHTFPIIEPVPSFAPIPLGEEGNWMPGGPRSKKLIPSYPHHIAPLLWMATQAEAGEPVTMVTNVESVAPSSAPQPEESRTPSIEPVAPSTPVPPKVDLTMRAQIVSAHMRFYAAKKADLSAEIREQIMDFALQLNGERPLRPLPISIFHEQPNK